MNKQQLIDELAIQTSVSKTLVERVLTALAETATEALRKGEEVALHGLGKLVAVERAARTINSPLVKGKLQLPASTGAKFKPSKILKDALN